MKRLIEQHWKVYNAPLRRGMDRIIEIQTKDERAVIPWAGFDDCAISKTNRLAIARHIVRLHNEDLNRENNYRKGFR